MAASSSRSRRILVSCRARPRWWARSTPASSLHAEHLDRQPAHGAGHPVAIEVERRRGRARRCRRPRPSAMPSITARKSACSRPKPRTGSTRNAASPGVLAGDRARARSRAPGLQRPGPLAAIADQIVGDVVHRPAEGVDGEHRRALAWSASASWRRRRSCRRPWLPSAAMSGRAHRRGFPGADRPVRAMAASARPAICGLE